MNTNQKQNYHHYKLPKLGEIGYLTNGQTRFGETIFLTAGKKEKVMVVAFPLCDNVLPYSKGIHTAYFKNLANGKIKKYSGFYFDSVQ